MLLKALYVLHVLVLGFGKALGFILREGEKKRQRDGKRGILSKI